MPENRTENRWWLRLIRSAGRVSVLDVVLGVGLAGAGVALVTGLTGSPGRHGGVAAALAVLTMTLPVIWRRRAPVGVAAVLGAGAVLNALAIGRMVRCGPALPALLLCAFALGRRTPRLGRRPVSFAIACLILSAAVQSVTDPNLDPSILVPMVPMTLGLYGIGRLVESRSMLVARLRERNEELRHQRERVAQLAIAADRARIAEGLDESLSIRISDISKAAETGRQALAEQNEPDVAHEAFVTIERRGRETLQDMREVVGTLLETGAPSEPQPTLRQLDRLVERAGAADVRVHVTGRPRVLPAGVELSGYRTVEHLLDAFGERARGRVDIYVDFGADVLELKVCGPAVPLADQQTALAAAHARVAIHNGTLSSRRPAGEWEAVARLPLLAHA
jgi:signal transduction histidine kinase